MSQKKTKYKKREVEVRQKISPSGGTRGAPLYQRFFLQKNLPPWVQRGSPPSGIIRSCHLLPQRAHLGLWFETLVWPDCTLSPKFIVFVLIVKTCLRKAKKTRICPPIPLRLGPPRERGARGQEHISLFFYFSGDFSRFLVFGFFGGHFQSPPNRPFSGTTPRETTPRVYLARLRVYKERERM